MEAGIIYVITQGLGFPKIRATFLGVPIRRTEVFWGRYWGPPIFGKLPEKPRFHFILHVIFRLILNYYVKS